MYQKLNDTHVYQSQQGIISSTKTALRKVYTAHASCLMQALPYKEEIQKKQTKLFSVPDIAYTLQYMYY